MDYRPVSRLKPRFFKPVSAQPYPWLYFPVGKIANGFNFQTASFDRIFQFGHAATSLSSVRPRMKSAAFCACAAAYTMSVLSSRSCFSQFSR